MFSASYLLYLFSSLFQELHLPAHYDIYISISGVAQLRFFSYIIKGYFVLVTLSPCIIQEIAMFGPLLQNMLDLVPFVLCAV